MKNKIFNRSLSLVLALAMVLAMLPVFAPRAAAANGSYHTISQILENNRIALPQLTSDEEVEFLVELEQAPLADSAPLTLDDYIRSQNGSVTLRSIEDNQSVLAAAIEASQTPMTITHRYQMIFNGFAVRAPYSALAELEALEGVRRVELAQHYDLPATQAAAGEITSGSMIDSDRANDEGYTGKGTLTAILDTGFDVDHQAFANDPAEPAYTSADISSLMSSHTFKAKASAAQVYLGAKVPFAYDYADKDTNVNDAQGHGTHVAGTIGANADGFRGVAPDTQLCIMKVFSDREGGASDTDIMAALEDCILLGVDAINMSLGSPSGFTSGGQIVDDVYNRVRSAGVNLMVAAGNEQSAVAHNLLGTDLAPVANPDYGIVGAPSTYPAALSVASINEATSQQCRFLLGDQSIRYYDSNETTAKAFASLEGVYEYVRVPGVGNANDFSRVSVTGKIALVERGEIAFTEKEQNAKNAGAVGLIVYDNQDGPLFGMQLNGLIPAVSITKADGKLLKNAAEKKLDISQRHCGRFPDPTGGQMSDFSSIGVAPDLSMKPEITAPGGNIHSTVPGGKYADMSGTSMACPHMAGAAAVVRQYLDESLTGKTDQEKQTILNALMMSTASPVLASNGVPYSPRKQGAGLAQVHSAIHSGAYLTVDGSSRPKAELGDSVTGSFSFSFHVENFSDSEKTFALSLQPTVAEVAEVNGIRCISDFNRLLTADEITVSLSSQSVTVPAGGSAAVSVSMELTEAGRQALAVFSNGIYIEGFLSLTAQAGEDLSLPFLGFYGDWGKVPAFDASQYDASATPLMAACVMAAIDNNGQGRYLGINPLEDAFDADRISYASRSAGYQLPTPILGMLRAADELRFTAASAAEPEKLLYDVSYPNMMKSFYYPAGGFIYTPVISWGDAWQPIKFGRWYPDGQYTFTVSAKIAGSGEVQTMEFPFFIDNEAPEIQSTRYYLQDGQPFLEVKVLDNHYAMMAQLVDESGETPLCEPISVQQTALGEEGTLIFPLKDIQAAGHKLCHVVIADYAMNQFASNLISTVSQDIEPVKVQMSTTRITARTDSRNSEISATVAPSNAKDQTLTWTSSDESVAKIVSVSSNTHTAVIDFVGSGSCEIRATASNGVFGVTTVEVTAVENSWPSDNIIRRDGVYTVPNLSAETTVTITDNAHDVTLVGSAAKTYENLFINSENTALHLTIQNLNIKNGSWSAQNAIAFKGADNVLTLRGSNTFTAHDYMSYAMIRVDANTALTINGSGSITLNSQAYCDGAGIGADPGQAAGKITIESGDFHINTPGGGAAIGAGANHGTADITILGGTFDIRMPLSTDYPSNQTITGAAIGSGYYASEGNTKIRIDGGRFVGNTGVDSAIIGLGFKSTGSAIIDINSGTFDLTSDAAELHGGACIGAALPDSEKNATVDITINGGVINATSHSDAAAIGGGAGHKAGSIYINGGTVTASSTKGGDAIGHGAFGAEGNIRISGGTVKATVSGKGSAFGDTTLTNDDSDAVYLLTVSAPGVKSVTVNGVDWKIPQNHPADDNLYLYLPVGIHTVDWSDDAGTHSQQYEIDAQGHVRPVVPAQDFNVVCNLNHLTSNAPQTIRSGETLTVTLTPDEGYALPDQVYVTMADVETPCTYENGVVTVADVQGDVTIYADALLKLAGANVIMGNNLDMMFAIPETGMENWTGSYAVIHRTYADDRPATDTRIDFADWEKGQGIYMITYKGIAAKEMTDQLTVTVYNPNNGAITAPWVDSLRDYAMRILNKSSNSLQKTLLVDMLNYGAEAQKHFGYAETDLANNRLTEAQKALASELKPFESKLDRGDKWVGSNLILESNIKLMAAFKDVTPGMTAEVRFVNHMGKTITRTLDTFEQMNGLSVVTIEDLVVADARQVITITIRNADGSLVTTCQESIEDYLARMNSVTPLFAAIMKFADSAHAYLHA